MITYTYNLNDIKAYIEKDGLQNVIYKIAWELVATDEDENLEVYSYVSNFDMPNADNFIPSDELSKETIVGWIESTFGVIDTTNPEYSISIDDVKTSLAERIERKKQPNNSTSLKIE